MSDEVVHVAMFPSAGMGHLTPFLRLASLFLNNNCKVTLITPLPTVSLAESQLLDHFHSCFPQVNRVPFNLPPPPPSSSISVDPFFLRVQTLRNSTHLLPSLISSLSPPITVFISDILLFSPLNKITQKLSLPNYILNTSSSAMFSLFSHFPTLAQSLSSQEQEYDASDGVLVPGIPFSPLPYSSIPPFLLQPTSILRNLAMEDSPKLVYLHGVFANTFEALESHSLEALNSGKVVKNMPPVYAVGPFVPFEFEKGQKEASSPRSIKWLDDQPIGSVVYVCFGSRTTLGREQMKEIGDGLMRSGYKFLWVVKDKIVDKEEEVGLDEVLGVELVEKMKDRGLVVKEWVDQSEILSHKSVGGFVSHCGWNSITEAALNGVPILGWPQHGDQKINAKLVEISGWGVWNKSWGWGGELVVKGGEIGDAIKEMMKNELFKVKAIELKEEGRKAISVGGDCEVTIQKLIQKWKNNVNNI
ncbi:putative UDP-glucuronosyl/UDP-glucosyltransferase [Medicago truncatula]|uniref:Glycosyltransferase n=1 Tax=Medicago truncatula TaxID=3880 RepID=A0A396I8T3_MEDTR|nr:UDP-glycosyltransferase 708D1 [Medicago truncatula]RHN62020.1 putative UDP-glucuronosyl/UDP-glucosyltransferase [Medicago truncatula]